MPPFLKGRQKYKIQPNNKPYTKQIPAFFTRSPDVCINHDYHVNHKNQGSDGYLPFG